MNFADVNWAAILILLLIVIITSEVIKHFFLRKVGKFLITATLIIVILFYATSFIPKTNLEKTENKLLITSATIMEGIKENVKGSNISKKEDILKFNYDFKKDSLDTRKLYK